MCFIVVSDAFWAADTETIRVSVYIGVVAAWLVEDAMRFRPFQARIGVKITTAIITHATPTITIRSSALAQAVAKLKMQTKPSITPAINGCTTGQDDMTNDKIYRE